MLTLPPSLWDVRPAGTRGHQPGSRALGAVKGCAGLKAQTGSPVTVGPGTPVLVKGRAQCTWLRVYVPPPHQGRADREPGPVVESGPQSSSSSCRFQTQAGGDAEATCSSARAPTCHLPCAPYTNIWGSQVSVQEHTLRPCDIHALILTCSRTHPHEPTFTHALIPTLTFRCPAPCLPQAPASPVLCPRSPPQPLFQGSPPWRRQAADPADPPHAQGLHPRSFSSRHRN